MLVIALAAVVARLLAVPAGLADTDAVNFSLALEHFDLARHQPHFPGYPLYVLCARAFAAAGFDPLWALCLPGALASAALVLAVYVAMTRRVGAWAGLVAAVAVALDPTLVAIGGAPASDGLALAVIGCAFALLVGWPSSGPREPERARRASLLSGLVLGVALGVRPSYAPLALSLLLATALCHPVSRWRAVLHTTSGIAAGVGLWLVPFVVHVGAGGLLDAAGVHLAGHFARLDQTLPSITSVAGISTRGVMIAGQVFLGAAGAVSMMALALVVSPAARSALPLLGRLALITAPYALWVLGAQNVLHARHAAPLTLLPLLGAAIVLGRWASSARRAAASPSPLRWPLREAAAWPAAVLAAVIAWPLAISIYGPIASARSTPDTVAAVEWAAEHYGTVPVLLLGQHAPRVASWYAPTLRSGLARTGADVRRIADRFGGGVTILVTSEVELLDDGPPLETVARFGDMKLYAVRSSSLASAAVTP